MAMEHKIHFRPLAIALLLALALFMPASASAQADLDMKISAEERTANLKRAATAAQRHKEQLRQQIREEVARRQEMESDRTAAEEKSESLSSSLNLLGPYVTEAQNQYKQCIWNASGSNSYLCQSYWDRGEQLRIKYNEMNDALNWSNQNFNRHNARIESSNQRIEAMERQLND